MSSELKILGRHTGTILIGQLAVMAFGVADTVIAGRFSDSALAALSVGSALYISVYVALMGIVQALLPIWAQMLGARQHADVGRSLRQSLYLCGLITVVGMVALLFPGPLLRWAQVPDNMLTEVKHYLLVLAFAFAPALLFRVYSTFNQSLGKPRLVTWLQVLALLVKIPLSIWWVGGGAGVEAMGAVGCAWATLVVNYVLLILSVWMLRTQDLYAPFEIWRRIEPPDWRQLRNFVRLGLPGGLAYLVEVTSFTLMALFTSRMGTVATASHQVAGSIAAVLYMTPLSMALACSARVSYWLGADRPDLARHVVILGARLTLVTSLVLSTTVALAGHTLAGWYSANPQIVALASSLLVWVAVFHLADATQALCSFLLRCYRITVLPLVIYTVLLWGVGLPSGYRLAYRGIGDLPPSGSPISFWAASTVALSLVATGLAILLWYAVRQSIKPMTPSTAQIA